MHRRYGDHMDGWGAGEWFAMVLLMLVAVGALVALVVWLVRTTSRPTAAGPPSTAAEDVLAQRFARGEIDEEEFTKRRALLRAGP